MLQPAVEVYLFHLKSSTFRACRFEHFIWGYGLPAQSSLLYQHHQWVSRRTLSGGNAPGFCLRFGCELRDQALANRLGSGKPQLSRNRGSSCASHAATLSHGVCCELRPFYSRLNFDGCLTVCAFAWPKWSDRSTEASSSLRSRTWRTGRPWY